MIRAALLVSLLALSTAAFAQARLESAEECGVAADMAIVARSLAEEEVHAPKAATIMERIYNVAESRRGADLMKDIIAAAYRKETAVSSRVFAEQLFLTCLKSGGDLGVVLGKRL